MQHSLRKQITIIFGQDIFEHSLVKDHPETTSSINNCYNMKQVLCVLEIRYNEVNTKKISLSKGRWHYKKYLNENAAP